METVKVARFPDCDLCPDDSKCLGVYNAPTRSNDPLTGGRWANLCGEHFREHGLETSVTEVRVSDMDVPLEVLSIARRWSGKEAMVMAVDGEGRGPWRFTHAEDGFLYEVHAPGRGWAAVEDDGRPSGVARCEGWHVRCLNDAPDAHFEVGVDGVYRGYTNRPVDSRVW